MPLRVALRIEITSYLEPYTGSQANHNARNSVHSAARRRVTCAPARCTLSGTSLLAPPAINAPIAAIFSPITACTSAVRPSCAFNNYPHELCTTNRHIRHCVILVCHMHASAVATNPSALCRQFTPRTLSFALVLTCAASNAVNAFVLSPITACMSAVRPSCARKHDPA